MKISILIFGLLFLISNAADTVDLLDQSQVKFIIEHGDYFYKVPEYGYNKMSIIIQVYGTDKTSDYCNLINVYLSGFNYDPEDEKIINWPPQLVLECNHIPTGMADNFLLYVFPFQLIGAAKYYGVHVEVKDDAEIRVSLRVVNN